MIQRRAYLKRSTKPIRRQGKRGLANAKAHFDARKEFFERFAFQGCDKSDWCAYCQICGGPMGWYESNVCHKLDASLCGLEEPENYLIGHQLCNGATDLQIEMKREMRASEVNAKTGGQVTWTIKAAESLTEYLRKSGAQWVIHPSSAWQIKSTSEGRT